MRSFFLLYFVIMQNNSHAQSINHFCFNCSDVCVDPNKYSYNNINFCCTGCQIVYELLKANNLSNYYKMESAPGIKFEIPDADSFYFLEDLTYGNNLSALKIKI